MRALSVVTFAVMLALTGCGGSGEPSTAACESVDAPAPREDGGARRPSEPLDTSLTYVLAFETSCGDFEVTLDPELAPETAASLVSLVTAGFFDETTFHRVVPGFVVQGGDPTASGSGGPGYATTDPPPADARYTRGTVAMAKGELDPPGTAGSQFFVVTAEDAGLRPEYAIVGEVTSGYEVVERIDALGDFATERPSQAVVVDQVSVAQA